MERYKTDHERVWQEVFIVNFQDTPIRTAVRISFGREIPSGFESEINYFRLTIQKKR